MIILTSTILTLLLFVVLMEVLCELKFKSKRSKLPVVCKGYTSNEKFEGIVVWKIECTRCEGTGCRIKLKLPSKSNQVVEDNRRTKNEGQ